MIPRKERVGGKRSIWLMKLILSLLLVGAVFAAAQTSKPSHPSLVPVVDDPKLPRVLIIGDSISMGYTVTVREKLAGAANVHRIMENGGPTSRGIDKIDKWLGDGKWDVIHFNWGLHDLRYMDDGKRQVEPPEYEANLRKLVARMKQTGARLIWASTTPVPEGKLKPERRFGHEQAYNDIAAKVMQEEGVAVNDLYATALPKVGEFQKPQDVHFLPEGSVYLGDKVAAVIQAALKAE